MDIINRLVIAVLLIAVIYALYKYQQSITNYKSISYKSKGDKEGEGEDEVSLDGISQVSGDIDDLKSFPSMSSDGSGMSFMNQGTVESDGEGF